MPEVTVQPQQTTVEVQPDQMTVEVIGTPNTRTVFVESAVPGPPGPPGPSGLPDPGSNGIVVRTALNTTTARSIAAGTNVSVTNGDGVSGNPTVNVPDASTSTKGAVELATSAETTAGLAVQASDTRLSDARTPTAHASTHVTGGTDKIRDATASVDGLMTTAYASKLDGIEAGADVTDAQNVGSAINGSTAKTTPIDADVVPILDSAAANILKKVSWANIKATLKTYFDTLYPSGSGTSTGTNTGDQNLFGTIAVAGQSNVVADTTSDTLTLVAGSNVTITTNATTDSVTIAASGGIGGSTGATDNAVLRADGTGGSTLQNSTMTVADDGKVVINVNPNTDQALVIQGTDRSGFLGTNNYGSGLRSAFLFEVSDGSGFVCTSSNATVGHFYLRGDVDAHVAAFKDTSSAAGTGTNPQTLRIYETNPSTGNYERLTISAASGTNVIKPEAAGTGTASKVDYHLTASGVRITSGTGSPESVVSAPVGTLYHRTDGGAGTTVYIKESGTGNTGWTAIADTGITQLTGDVTAGPGNGSQAATIANDAVTYAKMQNVSAASKLLGRGDSGSGDVQEITIGSGLSMSGTTLSATGGGTGDVVGPASATDEAVVRFDSTTGKLIQNSVVTITDAGDIAGVNSIQMDTATPATLASQGQMAWNIDEETLDIQLNGFIMHTGEHLLYHVKNQTLSTIAKGVPVMFAGTDGSSGKLLIQPWNGTGPSTYFMGLTAEQMLNDEEGFVIAFGKLRGIQTNGGNYSQTWTDGEIIYAGTTTGSLTDTAPAAPNPRIQVCAVVNAHPSNGTLFVRPTYGSNIKDDEGVTITSLTTGNILVATSGGSTGVFENKAVSGDATLASTGALTIANGAVTYAKMQDVSAASKLIGRGDSGSGDPQEITLGTGLSMTGTTLAVTVTDTGITQLTGDVTAGPGSGSQAAAIANDAVTYAKMQNVSAASRLLGRGSASGSGDPEEITIGSGLSMSGTTLSATGGAGGVTGLELTTDWSTSNNSALQDITGLSFSMSANTSYLIEAYLIYTTTAAATGSEFGASGPASPTRINLQGYSANTAAAESNNVVTAFGSIVANANGSTTNRPARIVGVVRNGANSGTFQLQAKVETGITGTLTVKTGSVLAYTTITI